MSRTAILLKGRSMWARLLALTRQAETDKGLLTLIWFLRFGALLGLGIYFVTNQVSYSEHTLFQVKMALLAFFAYVVASGFVGTFRPEWFLSQKVKLAQVVIEIGLYSFFYYLTKEPQSEVYFLYFLPLFVAVRYLGVQWALATLGLASISLYIALHNIATSFSDYFIVRIYVYRELFMVGMTLLYALRRRHSAIADFQEEKSQLISAFKTFTDGVYVMDKDQRLLFVNDVLQAKHGPYTPRQACSSYFMCKDEVCGWCCPPIGSLTGPYIDTKGREGTFVDRDGHPYRIEVSCCPLTDESGQVIGGIVFVKDLSKQKQIERRLEEEFQRIERQVQALTSERTKWLETYNEMGKRLAGFGDPEELMQFVVSEAKNRLSAETSALFLLENGRLVRKAIAGVESNWFPEENYGVGEGITGQALVTQNGAKYGKPILVNKVDEHPMVVPFHLTKYKEKLATHEARHLIAVPLNGQEKSFGVLRVVNKLDRRRRLCVQGFRQEDVDFLVTIASMVAIAIENTRLLYREQKKRHLANTLRDVSKVVNSSLNLEEVLQHILNELSKVVAYDSTSIQLVDQNQLKIIACRGFDDSDKVMKLTFPIQDPKFPNYQVMMRRAPYIVEDVCVDYPHFVEEAERYHSMQIRSWLGVPLIYRDRVIGMISLDRKTPNYYTENSASLALTFANHVAMAIENARLFNETQQQMGELNTLYQASQTIASSLDVEEVLGKIVCLAGTVADSNHTGVVLIGEDGRFVTSVEDHEVGAPLHVRARPNGITKLIINTRCSIFFDELQDDGVTHNPVIIKQGFKSYGGVPIIGRDRVQGVLFVHSFKPYAFRGQATVLNTFCNQAAIAIENARFYKEAEQQARMLEKLVEASRRLIEHTSLEELCPFCADTGATVFDTEDCSLYVISEEKHTVDLVASSGIPTHVWTKREALIDGPGLTAHVARTGETLNFGGNEFKEHPAWAGRYEEPFLEHLEYLPSKRCHSLLLGPLVDSKGNRVGVLKLENKLGEGVDKCFSAFEVALHKTFASHIGTAIERARLFQRLDEEARQRARESLSDDVHDIMNVLHGALVYGTAYLGELAKRIDCDRDAMIRSTAKMAKAAQHIYESLKRIHRDVSDPILEQKGLIPALRHYANMLPIASHVTFQAIGREKLSSNIEYAVYKIVQEALSNVAKHAKLGGSGNVQVRLSKTAQGFQLVISDNGVGFDAETALDKDDAFGFQSMDRWAESIGAQLEISSQPGKGTRVSVSGCFKEVPNERKD